MCVFPSRKGILSFDNFFSPQFKTKRAIFFGKYFNKPVKTLLTATTTFNMYT